MKNFITILFLFSMLLTYSQDVTVVHFNYKWNQKNICWQRKNNRFKEGDNIKINFIFTFSTFRY